jgi:biotin carboxylase
LPHNPIDAAYATRNKHEMRTCLAGAGVPVPDFHRLSVDQDEEQSANEVAYPCVLKPLMMAASRGVIRADSPDEFVRAFRKIREIIRSPDAPRDAESQQHVLVEEYVPGWEVSVEGIVTNGQLHVCAIFDKPDPLEGPYFPESIYVTPSGRSQYEQERIESITREALHAMGLRNGPIHAELRGNGDHLWFIEVAARSIGGYCSKVLRFEGGLSLEDIIIRHALDPTQPLPQPEPGAAGVMMMQAPKAGRFKEALGLDRARSVGGVEEIIISAHPDQTLTPLPEGFLYLGFIFARAARPAQAERALREAYNRMQFVIESI